LSTDDIVPHSNAQNSAYSDATHKTDWALKWIPDQHSILGESSVAFTAVESILFSIRKADWALK
jgi:hypothetical protein